MPRKKTPAVVVRASMDAAADAALARRLATLSHNVGKLQRQCADFGLITLVLNHVARCDAKSPCAMKVTYNADGLPVLLETTHVCVDGGRVYTEISWSNGLPTFARGAREILQRWLSALQ